tara:strand:- start:89 stop:316 length:228 start_codon:yes stop_codon:yes gene_type:complete
MKKSTIIVAAIYLSGTFVSYNYVKFNLKEDRQKPEWTKGDRKFSMLLSCGSWCTVCAMGIVHGIRSIDNDEKANW